MKNIGRAVMDRLLGRDKVKELKAKELREMLEHIPDDAEVTFKVYPLGYQSFSVNKIVLVFNLGQDLWQIHITKEYPGLPK